MEGHGKGKGRNRELRLSSVDDRILRAVYSLHYLTAEQLCRLYYSKTSLNHVREQLKKLSDTGYLGRTFGPRSEAAGSAPWVYFLARDGLNYFKDQGQNVDRHYRPSEARAHSDPFLFHTLAINDVLIAARLLERIEDGVELTRVRHDLDLKKDPIRIETHRKNGQSKKRELVAVIPDAWLEFRASVPPRNKPLTLPVLLELDRASKDAKSFKRKVRALIAYIAGPYPKLFGTSHVTVAFVIDQSAVVSEAAAKKRLADTLRWTEEELTELGKKDWGSLFVFTLLPPRDQLDPVAFFLELTCQSPFSAAPLSLLDLPELVSQRERSDTRPSLVASHA